MSFCKTALDTARGREHNSFKAPIMASSLSQGKAALHAAEVEVPTHPAEGAAKGYLMPGNWETKAASKTRE